MKRLYIWLVPFIILQYNISAAGESDYINSYIVPIINERIVEVCIGGYVWLVSTHGIAQSFGNCASGLCAFECKLNNDSDSSEE